MLELLMAAPRSGKVPPIFPEEAQDISNFHGDNNLRFTVARGQPSQGVARDTNSQGAKVRGQLPLAA
jgi:hypothetical protein